MNDGGPAFPLPGKIPAAWNEKGQVIGIANHPGMTLRDYFAAKAMQGMLARTADRYGSCTGADGLSTAAYSIADAMLAEHSKTTEGGK